MESFLIEILVGGIAIVSGIAAMILGGRYMIRRRTTNKKEAEKDRKLKKFYERMAEKYPMKDDK